NRRSARLRRASASGTPRSRASGSRARVRRSITRRGSAELDERELGAEAGPEGAQDALLATAQAAGADHLVEDEEHGDGAHVPVLAQDLLRGGEVFGGEAELLAHHLDDAAAPR